MTTVTSFEVTPIQVIESVHHRGVMGDGQALSRGRIASLNDLVQDIWPQFEIPRGLVEHAVRDADESDLVLGETPETTSPLGLLDLASFGRWIMNAELFGTGSRRDPDSPGLEVGLGAILSGGSRICRFSLEGEIVSTLAFDSVGFAVPFPEGAHELAITVSPDSASDQAIQALQQECPEGEAEDLLIVRVYSGSNSWISDLVSRSVAGVHRIARGAAENGAFVVGRAVRVVSRSRKPHADPWAQGRRLHAERHNQDVATSCPDIDDEVRPADAAVVVVHGFVRHRSATGRGGARGRS